MTYKVLLVEDNPDIHEIITDYFGDKSHDEAEFTCVSNGYEAMAYANDSAFDLVLYAAGCGRIYNIANTGNQIQENQLKAIWQAYYKTDTTGSNPKGSGLGLSIVGSIMELHGFSYGVENTPDGVAFWLEF